MYKIIKIVSPIVASSTERSPIGYQSSTIQTSAMHSQYQDQQTPRNAASSRAIVICPRAFTTHMLWNRCKTKRCSRTIQHNPRNMGPKQAPLCLCKVHGISTTCASFSRESRLCSFSTSSPSVICIFSCSTCLGTGGCDTARRTSESASCSWYRRWWR